MSRKVQMWTQDLLEGLLWAETYSIGGWKMGKANESLLVTVSVSGLRKVIKPGGTLVPSVSWSKVSDIWVLSQMVFGF